MTWQNPDAVDVQELQFHMYLNAFRDANSTFMRESGGEHRGFTADGEERWGGIEVDQMHVVPEELVDNLPIGSSGSERIDITEAIRFIQPDDGNVDDQTVISVLLPEPVPPGGQVTVENELHSAASRNHRQDRLEEEGE